ncbi:MAG: hypothetical protein ACLP6G_12630 [Terriglobales bacterium]
MKSYFKLGVVFSVIALSIGASAGSVVTFDYTASLSGVSNTAVQGSFNYNTTTDTFTLASLSFKGNSIFNGIAGSDTVPQSGNTFVLNGTVDGYSILYTIVLNASGLYSVNGSISYGGTTGTFEFNQVPEGGSRLSYLAASGLVLCAGILLAGKQRRRPAEN